MTTPPTVDPLLRAVVHEIEQHAAAGGWDQRPRLFALVETARLLADDPGLAGVLDVPADADLAGSLTPVEQDPLPVDRPLEDLLLEVAWPEEVAGVAVVAERLVLPPSVGALPADPAEAARLAVEHPERQEVRMVVAVTRSGAAYCALRLRAHDEAAAVIEGPDLVPVLLQLLASTLA